MVPTGRSPELSAARLKELGFPLAIWPAVLISRPAPRWNMRSRTSPPTAPRRAGPVPSFDMKQLHELVGFDDVWAFEQRWAH